MNIFSLIKLAICHIFVVNSVCGLQSITFEDITELPASSGPIHEQRENEISVEVSIICDKDFGTIFHYNKTKILEYWKSIFLDIHQRFQTLQSVNISFVVLRIDIVETTEEQPYIGSERNKTELVPDIVVNFQKWLYTAVTTYVSDITILALGASSDNNTVGAASMGGACMMDSDQEWILGGLVVSIINSDVVGTLAHEIAHTLGAPHENEETYSAFDCGVYNNTKNQSLMEADLHAAVYFFSQCTDKIIAAFLQFDHQRLSCLKQQNSIRRPLFSTSLLSNVIPVPSSSYVAGISFQEQCQILQNNSLGYVMPKEERCNLSKCRFNISSTAKSLSTYELLNFKPIDGSPCNEHKNGFCFRGMCLAQGFQMINVASGECLGSPNPSSSNDKPILKKCPTAAPSPFDLVRILTKKGKQKLLFIVYSTPNGNETFRKCLTFTENVTDNTFVSRFERCGAGTLFEWDMIIQQNGELLFRHRETQQCLTAIRNTTETEIIGGSNCSSGTDKAMVWKLLMGNGDFAYSGDIVTTDFTPHVFIMIFVLLAIICIKKANAIIAKINSAAATF